MLKLVSLQDFPTPTFNEQTTASLLSDEPIFCTRTNLHEETQPFAVYLRGFPNVTITQDMLATRESARTIGSRDLFLPVQDSVFKKIANIFREKGIIEAIKTTAAENAQDVTRPVHWIATKLTWLLELIERGTLRSNGLPSSGTGSVADVAATRDWSTALIRCIAWHPHCTRLAVATRDDRIRIFSEGIAGIAVLRHNAQKSVCCMRWRPYSGRELAAACYDGVLLWTVELGAASNSLSHAVLLKHRNHAPVTSVSWHPQGDMLISCCLTDSNMMVWDVSKESAIPLRRVGGGGLCFSHWSPCGSRLLATTCRNVFRVWNIGIGAPWTAERWTVPNGRVAAACFGPNLTLLFTSTEDPAMIFSLPLQELIFDVKKTTTQNDAKIAMPLIDLSKVSFIGDDEEISAGGRVISMDWDPSGKYLAVMFQDSPLVAIFKTKIGATSRVTEVKPLYFLKGFFGEEPNCIQFYLNSKDTPDVAILTIAWSSGRVQHLPIANVIQKKCANQSQNLHNLTMSNTFSIKDDLHTSLYSEFFSFTQ